MIGYFALGIALLIGVILLAQWYLSAEPRQVVRATKWVLGVIGLGLILVLVVSGAYVLILGVLPFFLPLLLNLRALARRLRSAAGPSPGQSSTVKTRFIEMTLQHDSGELGGEVVDGPFAGQRLDHMSLDQLTELWRHCRAEDGESADVLEAYLDRVHGEAWRARVDAEGEAGPPGSDTIMSREEALAVLGLDADAKEADIRAAHHQLLRKVHPDRGGSNYLAAKINQAKDILLGD